MPSVSVFFFHFLITKILQNTVIMQNTLGMLLLYDQAVLHAYVGFHIKVAMGILRCSGGEEGGQMMRTSSGGGKAPHSSKG